MLTGKHGDVTDTAKRKPAAKKKPAKPKKLAAKAAKGLPKPMKESNPQTGLYLNQTQFAWMAGVSRETVAKRLEEESITPIGKRGKALIYSAKEFWAKVHPSNLGANANPDMMRPNDRLMHIKANAAQIDLDVKEGLLVKADDVRQVLMRANLLLQQQIGGLMDTLELRCNLTPDQIAVGLLVCEQTLVQYHDTLIASDDTGSG